MFQSHLNELSARLEQAACAAASAMGEAAVSAVRTQMEQGYASPIRETGALMADVSFTQSGRTVAVGSTLPYAAYIHEGTSRQAGRPYLTDGILGAASSLEETAGRALAESL